MKMHLVYFLCIIWSIANGFSQINNYTPANTFEQDAKIFINDMDPEFPGFSQNTTVQDYELANYAKQHPPIPLKLHSGNDALDQTEWETKVNDWFAKYPYFPSFIEYHKYNYLLKPEDDLIFYQTAKAEWIKRNPDKNKVAIGMDNAETIK